MISFYGLCTLKENIQRKEINIVINKSCEKNYINVNLENQLLIPKPNITENKNVSYFEAKYKLQNLQAIIDK